MGFGLGASRFLAFYPKHWKIRADTDFQSKPILFGATVQTKGCTAMAHYIVLVRDSVAVMKHHAHSNLGRKGFIWLSFPDHGPSSGKSGKKLKQREERNAVSWLAFWLASPSSYSASFLIQSRTTCIGVTPLTVGLTSYVNDQSRPGPYNMPTSQSDGNNSLCCCFLLPRWL